MKKKNNKKQKIKQNLFVVLVTKILNSNFSQNQQKNKNPKKSISKLNYIYS